MVTGSSDRTSRLWDIQSGKCVRVFTGHSGTVYAVAVSPDGKMVATAGRICASMSGFEGRVTKACVILKNRRRQDRGLVGYCVG